MKKRIRILVTVAFVLVLTGILLLLGLLQAIAPSQKELPKLEDYLAQTWKVFTLRAWDAETGTLELDYPLRFSYEQMVHYGAAIEELQTLPIGNLETISSLKTSVRETCGMVLHAVTVYGMSSDGQLAYTVFSDGSIATCWEQEPE